jgi:hypothetical protein
MKGPTIAGHGRCGNKTEAAMAEERRKGPPERRRSAKTAQAREQAADSAARTPESGEPQQARGQDPNDVARFDAEELDASIRTRQQEDRGEVF